MSETAQLPLAEPKRDRRFLTATQVDRLCRKHFEPPHFVYLRQVRNGTGYSRRTTRTADAIAMGTWPSRGVYLHGVEIKVSHSDFLAELKNPEKAEEIAQYCHFWWLAISHPKVAPLNEVPINWGVLCVSEDSEKMEVLRDATKKDATRPDHSLIAALLRRVGEDYLHKDGLREWEDNREAAIRKTCEGQAKYQLETANNVIDTLKKRIELIEKTLGVTIHEWNFPRFQQCYRMAEALSKNGRATIAAVQQLISLADKFRPELEAIAKELDVKGTE